MKQSNMAGRLTAFLLGGLLAIMPAIAAYAAPVSEATIDTTKTGSLTLYKYDMTTAQADGVEGSFIATGQADAQAESAYADYAIKGVEFTYLKVGEIDTYTGKDSNGATEVKIVYGLDSDAVSALLVPSEDAVDDKDGLQWFTSDILISALADSLADDEVAAKNTLEAYVLNGGTTMPETDASGRTSVSGLPLGLYLVVETAVPEDVVSTVNPFLVSLPMTTVDGDNWNYDVTAYPKNQTGNPDLEKEVAEVTSAKGGVPSYSDTATGSDGDVVAYKITSTLPKITSEATYLTTYTFVDTLSKGISYSKNDVTLTWFDTDKEQVTVWTEDDEQPMFTVSYEDKADGSSVMTIKMTEAGLAAINPAYSQYTVVIDYRCTIHSDDSVVYGDDGNPNEVTLEWRRTNMEYYDTLKDECIVYTYGLSLTKVFSDGKGDFSHVKFVVKNQTDGYYITARKETDGVYYVTGTVGADEQAATVFSPDSNGKLLIYGLEDDTYIATEIETDDGYLLLKDAITIVLISTEGEHGRTGSATVNGSAVTMEEVADSANALATLTVVNEKNYDVPFTGDTNTFLIPAVGLIGAAALFLLLLKKKKKEQPEA